MIGKIFKHSAYDVYYKVTSLDTITQTYIGKIIKSNSNHFVLGYQYYVFSDFSEEISEQEFNKIMVFE